MLHGLTIVFYTEVSTEVSWTSKEISAQHVLCFSPTRAQVGSRADPQAGKHRRRKHHEMLRQENSVVRAIELGRAYRQKVGRGLKSQHKCTGSVRAIDLGRAYQRHICVAG